MTSSPLLVNLLSEISENVVGGWEATPSTFPYQVHLSHTDGRGDPLRCGGVLLSISYILTAAHCLRGIKLGTLKVVAGDHDRRVLEGGEQEREIQFAILHPDYEESAHGTSDLAVVKVTRPFDFNENVTSAQFPKSRTKFKGVGVITGWGEFAPGALSQRLRYAALPLLSRLHCISVFNRTSVIITDRMLCAGTPSRGHCFGDSGGPLMCKEGETKEPILCGIVTHSKDCQSGEYPGIYADVSFHGQWIQEAMDGNISPNLFPEPVKAPRALGDSSDSNKCPSATHYPCTVWSSTICLVISESCSHGLTSCNELTERCALFRSRILSLPTSTTTSRPTTIESESSPTTIPMEPEDEGCAISYLLTGTWGKGNCSTPEVTPVIPTSFRCDQNLTEYNSSSKCDGKRDCYDWSDEMICIQSDHQLFRCLDGTHTWARNICNDRSDCEDSSDETNCSWYHKDYRCDNGETTLTIFKCDGDNDCDDWSDELGCLLPDGNSTTFNCTNGGGTRSYEDKCDGRNDCGDWSDELGCLRSDGNLTVFHCHNGNVISFLDEGDGWNDCEDWSDELGYRRVDGSLTVFFCANKKIVGFGSKCNTRDDCGDNSDELNCPYENKGLRGRLKECRKGEFTCTKATTPGRRCIPYDQRCDEKYQCPRGEDEAGCSEGNATISEGSCVPGRISCVMRPPFKGTCPPRRFMCDGTEQCLNGNDERDCLSLWLRIEPTTTTMKPLHPDGNLPCPGEEYRCLYDGICIPPKYVCDGDFDCAGEDDELDCEQKTAIIAKYGPLQRDNCTEDEYTCSSWGNCIPKSRLCDGWYDCENREDEANCFTTTTTRTPVSTIVPDSDRTIKSVSVTPSLKLENSRECLETEFSCPSTKDSEGVSCIPSRCVCNGAEDCPGGEDELNCSLIQDFQDSSSIKIIDRVSDSRKVVLNSPDRNVNT